MTNIKHVNMCNITIIQDIGYKVAGGGKQNFELPMNFPAMAHFGNVDILYYQTKRKSIMNLKNGEKIHSLYIKLLRNKSAIEFVV